MNRAAVRQQVAELHAKRSQAAWQQNGFQEDPGAADLIAKAKATRKQVTPTPKAAASEPESDNSIAALAPSRPKKK